MCILHIHVCVCVCACVRACVRVCVYIYMIKDVVTYINIVPKC